jgi:hypothetical protein
MAFSNSRLSIRTNSKEKLNNWPNLKFFPVLAIEIMSLCPTCAPPCLLRRSKCPDLTSSIASTTTTIRTCHQKGPTGHSTSGSPRDLTAKTLKWCSARISFLSSWGKPTRRSKTSSRSSSCKLTRKTKSLLPLMHIRKK